MEEEEGFSTTDGPKEEEVAPNGFICAVPQVLRPVTIYKVPCTIYLPEKAGKLTMDVTVGKDTLFTTTVAVPRPKSLAQTSVVVELSVPASTPLGSATVTVYGNAGFDFKAQTSEVQIAPPVNSLFIQLDKPIYRPGTTVRMFFVAVTENNMPLSEQIDLRISDPANNLIVKETLSSSRGIASYDLTLSEFPLLGSWTVEATVGDSLQGYQTFEVEEYVLPKFEVVLDHPKVLLQSSPTLTGSVKATYTFGKPVQGKVTLKLFETEDLIRPFFGVLEEDDASIGGTTQGRLVQEVSLTLDSNGFAKFALDVSKEPSAPKDEPVVEEGDVFEGRFAGGFIRPGFIPPFQFGKTLTLEATVVESATQETQSKTASIKTAVHPVDFAFDDLGQKWMKPGLPFYAILSGKNIDGTPAAGLKVQLEVSVNDKNAKQSVVLSENGESLLIVETTAETTYFNIRVVNEGNGDLYFSRSQPDTTSKSFVQLSVNPGPYSVGDKAMIRIASTEKDQSPISYVALAAGRIVASGSLTVGVEAAIPITEDLVPTVTVLAYYAQQGTGLVVADHIRFEVLPSLRSTLKVAFDTKADTVEPGSSVRLSASLPSVGAEEQSSVVVYAIDKSVSLLRARSDLSITGLAAERREKLVPVISDDTWSVSQTQAAISNAGFVLVTDRKIPKVERRFFFRNGALDDVAFDGAVPMAGMPEAGGVGGVEYAAVQRTRSFFPETWLWFVQTATGPQADLGAFTVPDTISTFQGGAFALSDTAGLAVAEPFSLTVFAPFFVTLNLPYSIVRSEQFTLRAAVFNHNTEQATVRVTVQPGDYDIISASEQIIVVPPGKAVGATFELKPTALGEVSIEVAAQSQLPVEYADALRRTVLVVPEGVTRNYVSNEFVDLSGDAAAEVDRILDIELPSDDSLVPGSARVEVSVTGDLMGPSIEGLEKLVQMPSGCGEQNMITLAPQVYVLGYFDATDQQQSDVRSKALNFMKIGIQRELGYERSSGGYSAFGDQDPESSSWLTAFVLKVFSQATQQVFVAEDILSRAAKFLTASQSRDGSFPILGRVIHQEMVGGQNGVFTLSCFVTAALIEADNAGVPGLAEPIQRALAYLAGRFDEVAASNQPYSVVLAAYVLQLRANKAQDRAFRALTKLAKREIDGTIYWNAVDATPQEEKVQGGDEFPVPLHSRYTRLPSKDVEMTAYALLAHVARKKTADAYPIVKWLSNQRSSFGGFHSTQDTVVGLHALSAFAASVFSASAFDVRITVAPEDGNGAVSAAATGPLSFHVHSDNFAVMQRELIKPIVSSQLRLKAQGRGIAIVQASVTWNEFPDEPEPPIRLEVSSGPTGNGAALNVEACAVTSKLDAATGMAVITVKLFSGFVADEDSLRALVKDVKNVKRYDIDGNAVHIYLDAITDKSSCYSFKALREYLVSNLQPVEVTAFDYYEPSFAASKMMAPGASVEKVALFGEAEPQQDDQDCPEDQHYEECGSACPLTCAAPEPRACTLQCVPGCYCNKGLLLNSKGVCVQAKKCEPRVCKARRFTDSGDKCRCRISGCYRCDLWPTGKKRCRKCFRKFELTNRGRCRRKSN